MKNTHDIVTLKDKFLEYELGVLTLKGALSTRNQNWPIYAPSTNYQQRDEVQGVLRCHLDRLRDEYSGTGVAESAHVERIASLASEVSSKFGSIMYEGKFRFGVAQKLINLHLKYLWVAGLLIPEPPHCPIDGRVRDANGLDYNWISSNDAKDYEDAIKQLRGKARTESLALYELRTFRRPRQDVA